MKFRSQYELGPEMMSFSQDQIKQEPMFFNCEVSYAYEAGGPITRNFINNLDSRYYHGILEMDRPILMNAAMVRAVLSGQKTQTRQPLRPFLSKVIWGDRLWVRETFAYVTCNPTDPGAFQGKDRGITSDHGEFFQVRYAADSQLIDWEPPTFKPSIHMPRWASRITLPLVSVRVERVQDISEADAIADGLRRADFGWTDGTTGYDTVSARDAFRELWDSIYGTWDANPWVWVAEWDKAEVAQG